MSQFPAPRSFDQSTSTACPPQAATQQPSDQFSVAQVTLRRPGGSRPCSRRSGGTVLARGLDLAKPDLEIKPLLAGTGLEASIIEKNKYQI